MEVDSALIRRLRTEQGWSQEELAIASDLSTRTVQRVEADSTASRSTVQSIAAALEVSAHNIEKRPRTHALGARLGFGGVIVGTACAAVGIAVGVQSSDWSGYQAGISMGVVGLFSGLSCAFIGWASSRSP